MKFKILDIVRLESDKYKIGGTGLVMSYRKLSTGNFDITMYIVKWADKSYSICLEDELSFVSR